MELYPQLITAVLDYDFAEVRRLATEGAPLTPPAVGGKRPWSALELTLMNTKILPKSRYVRMVKTLVDLGADVTVRVGWNNGTILHEVKWCAFEIMKVMLPAGADPTVVDNEGRSPLHLWARMRCTPKQANEAVALLVSHGVDLNARDNEGSTPLHRAAASPAKNSAMVRALLDAGADATIVNNAGERPLPARAKE